MAFARGSPKLLSRGEGEGERQEASSPTQLVGTLEFTSIYDFEEAHSLSRIRGRGGRRSNNNNNNVSGLLHYSNSYDQLNPALLLM